MPVKICCRFLFALLVCFFVVSDVSANEDYPNIIIILADDFGVGDIQAHYPENKIKTPHLDRLVAQGMSFTDAHSPSSVCSPTRYGLLTGRYSWRTRLQEWVIGAYEPPLISEERPTLPEFLKKNGYHTACIGKWHLGWDWPGPQKGKMTEPRNAQRHFEWDFEKPIKGGPVDRGFDYYFGVDLPNLPPFTWIENDGIVDQPTEKYKFNPSQGTVMPRGSEGCPIAPNWEFDQIMPELTKRCVKHIHDRAKADEPFFLYFSMTSPHEPIVPSKEFKDKSGIAPIADFVMETDWSAGQVIKAVEDAGISENTIVIFTADNGHSHYTGWKELVDAGHKPSGPFRGHKGTIWEGGHRVPLVIRWPEKLAAGSTNAQLVCLTDLFATCAEIVDKELPSNGAEDSFSFLSEARGVREKDSSARKSIVHHSVSGEFSYRAGPWKLVFKMGEGNLNKSRGKPTIVELYNLDSDVAESVDLATTQADRVAQLTEEFRELIARGSSRPGQKSQNDCDVQFEITQTQRWQKDNQN